MPNFITSGATYLVAKSQEPFGTATAQKWVFPTDAQLKTFPTDLHVEPVAVTTKAADGQDVFNQLFIPKDIKPGEKRPAKTVARTMTYQAKANVTA